MVFACLHRGCHILGRVQAFVKFEVVQVLADESYLSWIAPDAKSKKKGCSRIAVRGKRVHHRAGRTAANLAADYRFD